MASYSPNFTARYRIRYTCNGTRYQNQFRVAGSSTVLATEFLEALEGVYEALAIFRFADWAAEGADFAPAGSDIFLPADLPAIQAGDASVVGRTRANTAVYLGFGSRSFLNNRTRLSFYGVNINPLGANVTTNQDYRLYFGESSGVAGVLSALNTLAQNGWACNDGNPATFIDPYANIGVSAYRQRKLRQSA